MSNSLFPSLDDGVDHREDCDACSPCSCAKPPRVRWLWLWSRTRLGRRLEVQVGRFYVMVQLQRRPS